MDEIRELRRGDFRSIKRNPKQWTENSDNYIVFEKIIFS